MSQTISAVPAGNYTFSFDWFRRRADESGSGGSGEEINYSVTGSGGLSITGDTTGYQIPSMWHMESQTVTLATAGNVTLSFADADTGGDWGIGVDNIAFSLTAIPEPGSLLGLGCLMGAGVLLRNRRR